MNGKQKKALKQLEEAFREASEAGLSFIGMDSELLVFSYNKLKRAGYFGPGVSDVLEILRSLDQGTMVDTSGTYLDSGGW